MFWFLILLSVCAITGLCIQSCLSWDWNFPPFTDTTSSPQCGFVTFCVEVCIAVNIFHVVQMSGFFRACFEGISASRNKEARVTVPPGYLEV